jgi:HD-like signal output (HDOD) protein
MEKETLTPSLVRLLAVEEELVDIGAKHRFSQGHVRPGKVVEGTGKILCSVIDGMPSLPLYAGSLFRTVNTTDSTSAAVSKTIGEDPTLAALILKNVNSPYYGFPQQIVDLQHAITLLGTKQIHLLILYHGMRTTLPNTRSFVNLQSESVLLSYLASALAELVDPQRAPLCSTLGLLSRLGFGVIFLAQHKHPEIEKVAPLLNQYKIGSMLLIRWDLPEAIHETIRLLGHAKYARPDEIPEAYRLNVAILTIALSLLEQHRGENQESAAYLEDYLKCAGFGDMPLESLAQNRLLPLLRQKKNILPHVVRNYLNTCPRKAVTIKRSSIGAVEKRTLERKSVAAESAGQTTPPETVQGMESRSTGRSGLGVTAGESETPASELTGAAQDNGLISRLLKFFKKLIRFQPG